MPTRQYVGARYVPKFATPVEHDNTRAYEALEIVTHLGTSYTSKKPVPVGIAINNTEYWVATGNYNAQVEQYRQEVVNVQSDVDALETRVNLLDNDHYIIIGDSYGVHSEDRGTSWAEYLEQFMGMTVAKTNAEVTSATNCWDMTRGGEGFVDGNTQWGYWLDTLTNEYPADYDKNKVTKFIIAGGYNDRYYTGEQILSAINSFANYVKVNFPYAKVYLACIGMGLQSSSEIASLFTVYESYKRGAEKNGWCYCTGMEGVLHNYANLYSDLHHPIPRGGIIIARSLKNIIMGATAEIVFERANVTPYEGEDYSASFSGTLAFDTGVNGLCAFLRNEYTRTVTFSTAQALAVDTKIGTIATSYFQNLTSASCGVVPMKVKNSSNQYSVIPIGISVEPDGDVNIKRPGTGFSGPFLEVEIPSGVVFEQCLYTT